MEALFGFARAKPRFAPNCTPVSYLFMARLYFKRLSHLAFKQTRGHLAASIDALGRGRARNRHDISFRTS